MKLLKKYAKEETGTPLLEFVVVFPLLLIMLSLIMGYAQFFYASQVALTAADIGTRIAVIQENPSDARKKASEAALPYISAYGMGITFRSDEMEYGSWKRGEICTYSVTIDVKLPMAVPIKGTLKPVQTITKSGHMMIESE